MAAPVDDPKRAWIERVLAVSFTAGEQDTGVKADAPQPKPRAVAPGIAFTQSRLIWDSTRKQVQAELQKLEQTILEECKEEPDFEKIAGNSKILYSVLDFLDVRLIDKLDEALNAETPEKRVALQTEARNIIDEYVDYMGADELLRDIDDNGFIDIRVRETVSGQLETISRNLKALGA